MEPVVITGMAVLAASGTETAHFWDNLQAGRSALGPLTRVQSARLTTGVAGEILDFDPETQFGKEGELLDRFAQFAVICARRALEHAGMAQRSPDWHYAA